MVVMLMQFRIHRKYVTVIVQNADYKTADRFADLLQEMRMDCPKYTDGIPDDKVESVMAQKRIRNDTAIRDFSRNSFRFTS